MRKLNKLLAFILALALICSMAVPIMAQEENLFYVTGCERLEKGVKISFSKEVDNTSPEQVTETFEGETKAMKPGDVSGNTVSMSLPFSKFLSGFPALLAASGSGRYEVDNVLYESVTVSEAEELYVNSFEKTDDNGFFVTLNDDVNETGAITASKDGIAFVDAEVKKENNKVYISLPEGLKNSSGTFVFKVSGISGVNGGVLKEEREYSLTRKGIYEDFSNSSTGIWRRTDQDITKKFSEMTAESESTRANGEYALIEDSAMALLANHSYDSGTADRIANNYENGVDGKKINSYYENLSGPVPLRDYSTDGNTEFSFDIKKYYDKTDENTSVHALFRVEDMQGSGETNDTNTRYKTMVKNAYSITYFEYADKWKYDSDGVTIANAPVIRLKKYTGNEYNGFVTLCGSNDEKGTVLKSYKKEIAEGEKIRIKVILTDVKSASGTVESTKIDVYMASYS